VVSLVSTFQLPEAPFVRVEMAVSPHFGDVGNLKKFENIQESGRPERGIALFVE
jgi:hypothetical protein